MITDSLPEDDVTAGPSEEGGVASPEASFDAVPGEIWTSIEFI